MTGLREQYDSLCQQWGCRPNSQVRKMLAMSPLDAASSGALDLDLSKNIIGSRGILPVLKTAASLPFLRSLRLRDNYLTNESIQQLGDHLDGHPSLVEIDVSANAISQPAGKRLLLLVSRTPQLRVLEMEDTLINIGLQQRIQAVLASRRETDNAVPVEPERSVAARCEAPPTSTSAAAPPVIEQERTEQAAIAARRKEICEALVAPPTSLPHLCSVYQLLSQVDNSSATMMTTSKYQGVAILLRSGRRAAVEPPVDEVGSPPSPRHTATKPDKVVNVEEYPTGTIGRLLLGSEKRSASGTISSRVIMPFHTLHFLFNLPAGKFGGMDLLMRSVVKRSVVSFADATMLPTLSSMRCDSDDLKRRDPLRAGLNLLLYSAFGDANDYPMFGEMYSSQRAAAASVMTGADTTVAETLDCVTMGQHSHAQSVNSDTSFIPAAELPEVVTSSPFDGSKEEGGSAASTTNGPRSVDQENIKKFAKPVPWDSLATLIEASKETAKEGGEEYTTEYQGIQRLDDAMKTKGPPTGMSPVPVVVPSHSFSQLLQRSAA